MMQRGNCCGSQDVAIPTSKLRKTIQEEDKSATPSVRPSGTSSTSRGSKFVCTIFKIKLFNSMSETQASENANSISSSASATSR